MRRPKGVPSTYHISIVNATQPRARSTEGAAYARLAMDNNCPERRRKLSEQVPSFLNIKLFPITYTCSVNHGTNLNLLVLGKFYRKTKT